MTTPSVPPGLSEQAQRIIVSLRAHIAKYRGEAVTDDGVDTRAILAVLEGLAQPAVYICGGTPTAGDLEQLAAFGDRLRSQAPSGPGPDALREAAALLRRRAASKAGDKNYAASSECEQCAMLIDRMIAEAGASPSHGSTT